MPRFDVNNYVDVAERIEQFYAEHPEGRIVTDLVNVGWDGPQSQFIVHASVFVKQDEFEFSDGALVHVAYTLKATGLAEESFGPSGPNQTSALENAETSAIGRALANMGYQTTRDGKRQRPSREEMEKVERGTNVTTEPTELQQLFTLLTNSGLTKRQQQEVIEAAVGRPITRLDELVDDEVGKALRAIEGAVADADQLAEEPF